MDIYIYIYTHKYRYDIASYWMKLDCIFSSWGWSSITRVKKNPKYLTIAHMPCFDHGTYRYGQLFPEDAIFDSWIFGASWREIPCNSVDSKWAEWRKKSEQLGFQEGKLLKTVYGVYLEISWQDTSPKISVAWQEHCVCWNFVARHIPKISVAWQEPCGSKNRNCRIAHFGRNNVFSLWQVLRKLAIPANT